MRCLLLPVFLLLALVGGAQTVPQQDIIYPHQGNTETKSHISFSQFSKKRWFVSRYSGLSTGIGVFNGGSANYVSIPVGIQLYHKLSNNLFAFAGIVAAPNYINFNRSFQSFADHSGNGGKRLFPSGAYGLNSQAKLGLMYLSSDRTFSVSGSISVQRGGYPVYFFQPSPVFNNPVFHPERQ